MIVYVKKNSFTIVSECKRKIMRKKDGNERNTRTQAFNRKRKVEK